MNKVGKLQQRWFKLVDIISLYADLRKPELSIAEVLISVTTTFPDATLRLATSLSWSHLTFSCNLEVFIGTQ